nr:M23 family metallopeptidase [Bacteroidota bacterium]
MSVKPNNSNKKKSWAAKLRRKYRLVLLDEGSFEEKISFNLTRLGVIIIAGSSIVVLILLTIYLVAFTSLRTYIPGYTDITLPKKIYELQLKTDSLERAFQRKDLFIYNLKRIMEGKDSVGEMPPLPENTSSYMEISDNPSREDSVLRSQYDNQNLYNINPGRSYNFRPSSLGNINFFTPLNGIITKGFESKQGHYGVDIVSNKNEAIKSVLDGTVIFSDWTLETGYVIGIQHQNNLLSVYKHNSTLLKQQGTFVRAGETISIVGESGELSTGPHLHFELWYNGKAINPEEFITF